MKNIRWGSPMQILGVSDSFLDVSDQKKNASPKGFITGTRDLFRFRESVK